MDWKRTVAIFAASVAIGTPALAAKGGGGGGGGGLPPASVLPTTPPEANVVLRESFGPGPDLLFARPQGGSAALRNVFAGTDLGGFWLEYPGSKSAVWSTPSTGGHWIFAFASLNPLEAMVSPLQPLPFNGIAFSDWSDGVVTTSDLVIPFRGVATKYSVSAELFPAFLAGSYVGFGLTTSGALNANLPASGQIWVRLTQVDPVANGADGQYDIMAGNSVLASGLVNLEGFNPVQITVDPAAQTFNVMLNGFDLGTWAARLTPSFIAFEGQGWGDNLVVRTVP